MTAPPRYDLLPSSSVNNEVVSFNRQLIKRMTPYDNVRILETGLEREYFTKHVMHLNSSGKECIARRLAIVVRNFLKKKTTASNVPIVAPSVITSLSLTRNRDWVLCIEYEVFI